MLSVLMPVYNERHTVGTILIIVCRCLPNVSKEIIVVDDCSRDGTREWLKGNFPEGERRGSTVDLGRDGNLTFSEVPGSSRVIIRPVYHERNKGKGGAARRGPSLSTMRRKPPNDSR